MRLLTDFVRYLIRRPLYRGFQKTLRRMGL